MYAPIQKIRKQNNIKVLGSNLTRGPIQDSPNQPNSPMCLREKIHSFNKLHYVGIVNVKQQYI